MYGTIPTDATIKLVPAKLENQSVSLNNRPITTTSVGAEKDFPAAGTLSTKLCTKMSNELLDSLCFRPAFYHSSSGTQEPD